MLSGTIPPSIFNLSEIVQISVSRNQLHGSIPSFLRFAPHLEMFHLPQNKFTGNIPLSIANATNLKSFFVGHNNLTGQVPNLQKLHKLVDFSITGNSLGSDRQGDLSFISELVNASRLRWLEIGYNNFGGTLPMSISNLTANLDTFWLPGNKLHGSIPSSIGNLVNLQSLGMWGNYFTGSIPTEIGKLSKLVELYFHSNKLSSSIPPSLGNLTKLNILYLYGNNLNGSIPPSLGNCQRLLDLDLSENKFDGTIPPQLLSGLLSLSISLYLFANRLTGSLPMEIGNLKSLSALDVCDNMLSGQLPSSLGNCEILDVLHLQGNFFQGSIPSSMKNLRGLGDLDLSRNNFSGNIPEFFKGFQDLVNLNLSFNNFWGEVPTEGVFENASAISVVGNTRLCGGIANLQLRMCHRKGGLSHRMKLIICLVSGFTLAVVLSFFLLHKRRKETQSSTSENSTWQVSYATLLKATDDFSSMNLIGVGAFGSVYKGILSDDGVTVAVKVFNMLHHGASKSFMAECEALKNIRHRNLVKILTACSSIDFKGNDFKALVYEFMENGSLEEWLHPSTENKEVLDASRTLSLVQRLDIVIDVANALDYLHNHCETPIVHCDLKPSNVLLSEEFTGHVSDFGLAKFLSNSTNSDSANQPSSIGIRGSVGYAAPEYGMGSEVSTNGDVYSFGILLLEMFTEKRPTDHMFSDGLNLHNYVKAALQVNGSAKIADSLAFQVDVTKNFNKIPDQCNAREKKMEECLTLIFGIGIACSVESPTNQKGMDDVVYELMSIRNNLLA